MDVLLVPLLEAMIRTATPLAFAALGELVAERSGVINIGLEGAIIAGCFGALLAASGGGVAAGFAGAAVGGMIITALFALFVVTWRADQIITGTALTMLGLGLTGTLHRMSVGAVAAATDLPTLGAARIPGLASIPILGEPLFDQPPSTYILYFVIPVLGWWLHRTHAGLALRATGEDPVAARNAGIAVGRMRWGALLFSGAMAGIAGGTLVLAQVGSFAEGMSAGRGFIAISIVVLGRWSVRGTALAALVFGAAFGLQYASQSTGWDVPYQAFLATPYVLTLVLLASLRGRVAAPAALAK
jgi:simple sugar transport system permease protein